ncbi:MAG: hypothetical protein H7Y14_02835 [Burkholderiales bacterium]|nr:hypothetical protein [Burkholderiales bacterium]
MGAKVETFDHRLIEVAPKVEPARSFLEASSRSLRPLTLEFLDTAA